MKVICLIGPTGSGKTRIEKDVVRKLNLKKIVSHTSRPMREYEIDGEDYHFVTDEEFLALVDEGGMIEHTRYNNWNYGIHKDSIKEGENYILVVEPHGYHQIKENLGEENIASVFIESSDKERLIRALTRESNPDVEEIIRRYHSDKIDFKKGDINPKYIVYNRDGAYSESFKIISKIINIELGGSDIG